MPTTQSAQMIHSTWFFNNDVNLKLIEHGRIHRIFHVTDIKNLLEIDNLEEYINNIYNKYNLQLI